MVCRLQNQMASIRIQGKHYHYNKGSNISQLVRKPSFYELPDCNKLTNQRVLRVRVLLCLINQGILNSILQNRIQN